MMPKLVWNADPVLITVLDVPIRYYTLCFSLTLFFGYMVLARQLERGGGDREDAGDFFTYGFFGLLVGARVGHVLFYDLERFLSEPSWLLRVWTGGMASHGALVGLCIAMYWFTRQRAVPFLEGTDRLAFAVPVGAFFFRLGNLFNSEIVGKATDGSWGMRFPRYDSFEGVDGTYRHPTQLYEMVLALLVFALLVGVDRKFGREARPRGLITGVLLSALFSGRILVELFKEPQLNEDVSGFLNLGQVLSVPAVLAGSAIVVVSLRNRAPAGWIVGAGVSKPRKRYDDEDDDDFDDEDGGPDPHEPPTTLSRA